MVLEEVGGRIMQWLFLDHTKYPLKDCGPETSRVSPSGKYLLPPQKIINNCSTRKKLTWLQGPHLYSDVW